MVEVLIIEIVNLKKNFRYDFVWYFLYIINKGGGIVY